MHHSQWKTDKSADYGELESQSGSRQDVQVSIACAHKAQPLKNLAPTPLWSLPWMVTRDTTTNRPSTQLVSFIHVIVKSVRSDSRNHAQPGLIISSALIKVEIVEMLSSTGLSLMELNAQMCSSACEV
ncbi:hypothetical protein M758_1G194500 [Ceratodon purpureus]|uniref:Uncharacterized protein n=1 Tax=Ceratodon purpureus TaxID=3225 RepID=A0A8T0JB06_CERPU|nr:hypothetical protein KC19_1G226600 [Ceratodon purpureus]KAG0630657.1 hypothetical protein M758_1G194500 [Ceratodon purpureus]